jgi:hypothetical protein
VENVDGFTVERVNGNVVLTFTNIVGEGEVFLFPPDDAKRIAEALLDAAGP